MQSTLLVAVAVVCMAAGVASHGMLLKPVSRAVRVAKNTTEGLLFAGTCEKSVCKWYTQKTSIPGPTTNCDPKFRTMGVSCASKAPSMVDWPCTPGEAVPWCAPGTAPVKSPCGIFGGGSGFNGRDMRDLDGPAVETWVAGSEAEVVWNIVANHGGGYAYRLCPKGSDLSEECFQAHHLNFASSASWLVNASGYEITEFDAVRLNQGTTPQGSTWTRNPVPMEEGSIAPIPGHPDMYGRGPFPLSVKDRVQVPRDLVPGDYVLSFRWDSEQVQQVWAQCSDVKIVNPKFSANTRAGATAVARAKRFADKPYPIPSNVCLGTSIGLDVDECNAWGEVFDAMLAGTPVYAASRADPCMSGLNDTWAINTICTGFRDMLSLIELYMLGPVVKGTVPDAIGRLTSLRALSIATTNVEGTLPESLGNLSKLEMLWLDHNPKLTGPLPQSFAKFQNLSVLEMERSGFSGSVLPALPYRYIPDCTLNGLVFKCPLPKGAETCGATCQ